MFREHTEFYLQKVESIKKQGLAYSINSGEKIIGTIQENQNPSKKTGNQVIKLISLLFLTMPKRAIIENLQLKLLDKEGKIIGTITKQAGFYKDLLLYTKDEEHIATVKSAVKVKSPSMTVTDANGNYLIKATGGYGATDFSVSNSRTNNQISSIKKRSLIYSTIKENLVNNDVYHFNNKDQDSVVTFALIGMGVALDIYFHMGE